MAFGKKWKHMYDVSDLTAYKGIVSLVISNGHKINDNHAFLQG